METNRLLIRPMRESDHNAFLCGVADRSLRIAYGFPKDMDETTSLRIFRHFCELPGAYSMIEKRTGNMIGFLLEVDSELPESIAENLPGEGRTLAFAVFHPYQRQGYMEEALNSFIPQLFRNHAVAYIHCGHFIDNEPSRQLLQKTGFHVHANHTVKEKIIIDLIKYNSLQNSACRDDARGRESLPPEGKVARR